ncbi:MAG: DUF1294 domain-containing protein [Syntrophomonadaceae bacterium]|jgi:uncharacterized membrane protein YsdA (DUF1294 family)
MAVSGFAQQALLFYGLAINTLCYVLFALDKGYSQRGEQRIPERTLFMTAILGGALGGVLAMHQFQHKTRHKRFKYGFTLILALQVALLSCFLVGM